MCILGLILSAWGLLHTVTTTDIFEVIGGPFSLIEETITTFATIYGGVQVGEYFGRFLIWLQEQEGI
jgi:hypothetical protein